MSPPTREFYNFHVTQTLLKLVNKTEREGVFPNSFLEYSIILIPKPDEDSTKIYNYSSAPTFPKDADVTTPSVIV